MWSYCQVMIEKWLLVVLIVGCTSLVFLICFPIDFFLYRRRKRLARERKNKLPIYQLRNTPRAEQNHAKIHTQPTRQMGIEEARESRRKTLDSFKAQVGLAKFFNKMKKKQNAEDPLYSGKELTDSRSENSTEFQILSTTPDIMTSTNNVSHYSETGSSTDDILKHVSVKEAVVRNNNEKLTTENTDNDNSGNLKFTNVSDAWGENEELVDHESKHLNYGALEPYGNVLQTRPSSLVPGEQCFTIPMNKRYKILRTDASESCTEFDVFSDEKPSDNYTCDDSRERFKPAPLTIGSNDRNIEPFVEHYEPLRTGSRGRVRSCEAALFDRFDTPCNEGLSRHPRHKVLEHSFSDQFISYCPNTNTDRTNSRKSKKRNIVSPSPKQPKCFSEQFEDENNDQGSVNKIRNEFLISQEGSTPINISKKRKKKKHLTKRQSSESMPELFTNKQKF